MKKPALFRRDFLVIMCGILLAAPMASGAAERYGGWDTRSRAEVAEEFMIRMQEEFKARTGRLQTEMGKAPEIKLPFIESRDSVEPGVIKDWQDFRDGKMSDLPEGIRQFEQVRGRTVQKIRHKDPTPAISQSEVLTTTAMVQAGYLASRRAYNPRRAGCPRLLAPRFRWVRLRPWTS